MSDLIAALLALIALLAHPSPPPAGIADYQLGGAYAPAAEVQIVVRDRTDPPARGRYSICYVNAFQTQPGSDPWWKKQHPELLLRDPSTGRLVRDPGWPDEILLDIRTSAKRAALATVVGAWFDGALPTASRVSSRTTSTRGPGRVASSARSMPWRSPSS